MKVYFIKPIEHEGPIKIGRSCSPDNRLATLATWCPFPLELVAQIEGPKELERRFHHHFLDLHIRHEWFRVSNELQAVIREINEGVFNVDTLPEPKKLPVAPRSTDYLTEAWRYQRSICSRLNFRKVTVHQSRAAEEFFGCDPARMNPEFLLQHKDTIEAFMAELHQQPASN